MPCATPEQQKEYQRLWYQRVAKKRRQQWFEDNGPCRQCGSTNDLQLDHVDVFTKVSHSVWSWSKQRRDEELKKCQVLCKDCHDKKSGIDREKLGLYDKMRVKDPDGMAWCYAGTHFTSIALFTKNKAKRRGIQNECRVCRSKKRSGCVGLSVSPSSL
jgi:hypothetical protein